MSVAKIQLPRKPNYIKIEIEQNFFELFKKIELHSDSCFLLESLGHESYDSRYSIIGFDPEFMVRANGNHLYINETSYEYSNPYYALRELIPTDIISRNYAGGLVGYIAYEGMNYFEPSLKLPTLSTFDQFRFGLFLDGLILDKMTGEVLYFYYNNNRITEIQKIISDNKKKDYSFDISFLGYTFTEEDHKKAVLEVIEEIKSGNTFQCQIGFKTEYSITGDLIPIYEKLRKVNPSPHMFYLKLKDQKIIGASPELLFRLRSGEMETFPLAGSIRRGGNEEEDTNFAKILLNDPKEIAEHNMLVDLHRNDMGRVAKFGTVKVRRLMDIKKFSHIQHISSEVTGIIKKEDDMFSGFASSFPAGTLSGAPKIESMKIISRIEKLPRGPYGGALGHFGLNGNCTFAIPIRTLFVSGNYGYTQASGGIVYDSIPSNEYDEITRKSAALQNILFHYKNVRDKNESSYTR
ncbi:MAG: chorismate-binding protein [Leptospiraceae bacterium]|nr:chorismate-binding protein [Leptospiraceae bacterium]